jgi:hypothetical protein
MSNAQHTPRQQASSQLTRPAFIPTSTSQRSPRQATRVVRQRQTNRPPNACLILAAEVTDSRSRKTSSPGFQAILVLIPSRNVFCRRMKRLRKNPTSSVGNNSTPLSRKSPRIFPLSLTARLTRQCCNHRPVWARSHPFERKSPEQRNGPKPHRSNPAATGSPEGTAQAVWFPGLPPQRVAGLRRLRRGRGDFAIERRRLGATRLARGALHGDRQALQARGARILSEDAGRSCARVGGRTSRCVGPDFPRS